MEKLTKSMPLFKERNCSVSIVLDSRTRRKNAYEYPLSLRFTIDRKFFYLTVGNVSLMVQMLHLMPKMQQPTHNLSLAFGSKSSMISEQKTEVYALPQPRATNVLSNHSERFLEKMPLKDFVSVRQNFRSGKTGCTME